MASSTVLQFPLYKVMSDVKKRVENTLLGTFTGYEDENTHEIMGVDFELKLPKIPAYFLDAIVTEFRRDLTKENMILIYWSIKDESFYMVKPKATYTKTGVFYELEHTRDVLVMHIHSHNTMKAFFSGTDNRDEDCIGLYGVIGNLDKPVVSMAFRAGMEGSFKNLKASDLFSNLGGNIA